MPYKVIAHSGDITTSKMIKALRFLLQQPERSPFVIVFDNEIYYPKDVLWLIMQQLGYDAHAKLYSHFFKTYDVLRYINQQNKLCRKARSSSR